MYYPDDDDDNNNVNNNVNIHGLNSEEPETIRSDRQNMINSYMNFISSSTTSINNIINIIDRQQTSLNNILNSQNIRTIPRVRHSTLHRHRQSLYRNNLINRNRSTEHGFIPNNRNHRSASELIPDNISETILRRINASNREQFVNNFTTLLIREMQNSPTQQIPTQTQINASTESLTYKDIIEPLNSSCPISQIDFCEDNIVIQIKTCKHLFFESNLKQWFERKSCCPLCRHDILQDTYTMDDTTGETTQDTTGETTI